MYNSELDTFLAVAAAGSFSKAAKKSGIEFIQWSRQIIF